MSRTIHQPPMSDRVPNLSYYVTRNARRIPDRPAIVWRDRTWTWREFDQRVSALAIVLADLGIQRGDAVLVHSKNSNQMLEATFAAFRLGAVWVPTNFRIMPDEVIHLATTARAAVFLCQSDFPAHAAAVRSACPQTRILWLDGDAQAGEEASSVEDLVQPHIGNVIPDCEVSRESPCWLFFTSGTTGRSKAAVLTHGQMAYCIDNQLSEIVPATTEADGALIIAPLSHGAGGHQFNLVARGGKAVLLSTDRLDVDEAFRLIAQHRLTSMFTVPTILKMLVEHPSVDAYDHSSLRYVVYAGAPMYQPDQEMALRKLGPVLVQYYGLGEVTGNITVLPPSEHGDPRRVGSCGYERAGMQISIQDESGHELAPGETGEVCVIGPAVFAGYFDNPSANEKSFRGGWFRTGDLGYMDAQGFLFLTGRSSDMYISGGSNVYPKEIEDKILLHDGISEVAVVGVPDAKWGEVGVAVCVLRPGHSVSAEELIDWMRSRISSYRLPRKVVFWDALPRSGYGKIPKRMVQDELLKRGDVSAPSPARCGK